MYIKEHFIARKDSEIWLISGFYMYLYMYMYVVIWSGICVLRITTDFIDTCSVLPRQRNVPCASLLILFRQSNTFGGTTNTIKELDSVNIRTIERKVPTQ